MSAQLPACCWLGRFRPEQRTVCTPRDFSFHKFLPFTAEVKERTSPGLQKLSLSPENQGPDFAVRETRWLRMNQVYEGWGSHVCANTHTSRPAPFPAGARKRGRSRCKSVEEKSKPPHARPHMGQLVAVGDRINGWRGDPQKWFTVRVSEPSVLHLSERPRRSIPLATIFPCLQPIQLRIVSSSPRLPIRERGLTGSLPLRVPS